MDILKTFVLNDSTHDVTIVMKDGKPLFRANDVGIVLGLTNVRKSIRDFDEDEKMAVTQSYRLGGAVETTFLTREGVYRLVMRSNKPIARPFQKWVCSVIASIEDEGRYVTEDHVARIREEALAEGRAAAAADADLLKDQFEAASDAQRSAAMADAYDKKPVVYIGKIGSRDGKTLVKIGSTDNIKVRASVLRKKLGTFALLRCYRTVKNLEFERLLQRHDFIKKCRFTDEIVPGERSNEVFLLTTAEMGSLTLIASRNYPAFKDSRSVQDTLVSLDTKMSELTTLVKRKADEAGLSEDSSKAETGSAAASDESDYKTPNCGAEFRACRKVQKYSADGRTLLRTYSRMGEVIADMAPIAKTCLHEAEASKFLYKEHRWFFVPFDTPDDESFDIGETDTDRKPHTFCCIFELGADEQQITSAYASQTALAVHLKVSGALVCKALKINGEGIIKGKKYLLGTHCSAALIDAFVYNGGVMPRRTPAIGFIKKLNAATGDMVESYTSWADAMLKNKFGKPTLMKAVNGDLVLRGHKWSITKIK
jgi:prophage antirepressor-like protein